MSIATGRYEMAAIGAMLSDSGLAKVGSEILFTSDFEADEHQRIFDAICHLSRHKQDVNIVSVAILLRSWDWRSHGGFKNVLDKIGGMEYLSKCVFAIDQDNRAFCIRAVILDARNG